MFKKLLSIALAISLCISMSVITFAAPPETSEVSVDETVYPNGDKVWSITENGQKSTVYIYHDRDYILVDGEQIFIANEIAVLHNETVTRSIYQPYAANWVYMYSNSYSAEFQKAFSEYTAAVLGGLIGSSFGIQGSVAVSIATTAIVRAANKNVLDLERDTYGNQYVLNHYKYVDSAYADGIFIKTSTWYNPPIY